MQSTLTNNHWCTKVESFTHTIVATVNDCKLYVAKHLLLINKIFAPTIVWHSKQVTIHTLGYNKLVRYLLKHVKQTLHCWHMHIKYATKREVDELKIVRMLATV